MVAHSIDNLWAWFWSTLTQGGCHGLPCGHQGNCDRGSDQVIKHGSSYEGKGVRCAAIQPLCPFFGGPNPFTWRTNPRFACQGNLFKGYKACRDAEFVEYIKKKEDIYEEGGEVEYNQLMDWAVNKFKARKEAGSW
jgi:hypothetical protein